MLTLCVQKIVLQKHYHLHFATFLNTGMAQVAEILPHKTKDLFILLN